MNLLLEFNCLTEVNEHSAAAKLLIDTFGRDEEKQAINVICGKQNSRGYILPEEQAERDNMVRKYFNLMRELSQNSN